MDTPKKRVSRSSGRSSVIDSIKGCTIAGIKIQKEELRMRIAMPQYLRLAFRESIESKDVAGVSERYLSSVLKSEDESPQSCESPLVVFINSNSGGRHGPKLKHRLQELMGEEQVLDLQSVKPHEFVEYGLGCLEKMADLGDSCAKETREKLRIVVAGGDGTVGWVLSCLGVLIKQKREPVPPTAIMPLGTGNDLSRSFGWGGSFPYNWNSAVKSTLDKVCTSSVCRLDSWHVSISMPGGELVDPPHSLKPSSSSYSDHQQQQEQQGEEVCGRSYEGTFYNYFSVGMDAQVAYGFHHLRNEKPYLAQGPISNKMIYSSYSCTQGWFFTPCINNPNLRGLGNILRMFIKKVNCSDWEQITIPSTVRSIVVINLNNYASGRNPWGNLQPEYMEKKGFIEPHVDDGLIEVFGLKQGWHASLVMVKLISAKHLAQAAAIRFEFRGGEWKKAYMQMDGEPWKQPLQQDYSTFIDIKLVQYKSVMLNAAAISS
ncbi:diacylglycerol kinase 7-like [Impatiens glandulifera]|uniref:diacylglycerol kinase 7-like n=1 Tax=Impatiens glandulifera TaxID=253017 RepID=UPI001FB15DCB|nr:diacylglycerol kinase 7-like [Impatiens glandulifera]